MTRVSSSWRINLAASSVVTVLATVIVALNASSDSTVARASSDPPSGLYPALKSTGPSGITLSSPGQRQGDSTPSFPVSPPGEAVVAEHWPIASTIRAVRVNVPGISAWIAESYGGGVCALAWDGGTPSAVGFSCSPISDLAQGAGVELRDMPSRPGKVLKVGVVPSGTTSVSVTLPNGSAARAPVSDGAWAYLADETTTGRKG